MPRSLEQSCESQNTHVLSWGHMRPSQARKAAHDRQGKGTVLQSGQARHDCRTSNGNRRQRKQSTLLVVYRQPGLREEAGRAPGFVEAPVPHALGWVRRAWQGATGHVGSAQCCRIGPLHMPNPELGRANNKKKRRHARKPPAWPRITATRPRGGRRNKPTGAVCSLSERRGTCTGATPENISTRAPSASSSICLYDRKAVAHVNI